MRSTYMSHPFAAIFLASALASPAIAQDAPEGYLERLADCRAIADSEARLACYDREVGSVVAASEQGEVKMVSREDVRETRRRLFGSGSDDEALDTLQTTITRVQPYGRKGYLITTQEGSVWRISSPPLRFARPKTGQEVEFKAASLGSYFIRVNGQLGVKGVRVE